MKGSVQKDRIREADYSKSIELGDDYSAAPSDLCHHVLIELDAANWLKAYRRLTRQTWTIPDWEVAHLEEILASSNDMTESLAVALRLADLQASGDWFKAACKLAQTSTIDQLEEALYYIKDREEWVTAALALAHYELFNSFELGEYVVKVEIVYRDGKPHRKYINP
ncbi:MAG: hypothetical protein WCA35_09920 [Kovacikia sp.]